jgi:Putative prokaryotic signal transducing protein
MLVTVANFTEPWEAHMFRTRLQAEDIFAVVVHDHHVGMETYLALGLGGAKVQVPRDDAAAARAIERNAIAGRYRSELDAVFGQETESCPNCGAAGDFRMRPRLLHSSMAALFYLLMLGYASLPTVPSTIRSCRRCNTRWRRQLPE